jgi:LysM repeat protein
LFKIKIFATRFKCLLQILQIAAECFFCSKNAIFGIFRKRITMKRPILSVLFAILSLTPALRAQTPLYILFDATCMSQLEYSYTYSGQKLQMCSFARDDNELYFFLLDNSTDSKPEANPPKGVVTCLDVPMSAFVMQAINAGSKLCYFVFRQQNGYVTTPVKSGGYVIRSGTNFAFRSPNYDFVLDTADIDYARNLSQPGVKTPVYLTGRRKNDCLDLFSFRLEPTSKESPRADVDVIPGIGIISDRTGKTGAEMEQNVYRLLKVNGMNLDNYIYAYCRNTEKKDQSNAGTFITNVPADNTTGAFTPYEFSELDKETQSLPDTSKQKLASCPEQPGYGYHIVQPGETISSIARIYNINPQSLLEWNNIKNSNQIKVCDKLWLSKPLSVTTPTPTSSPDNNYHTVQKGETLVGIARKYNLTEARIRRLNNFPPSGNVVIQPGQKIVIAENAPELQSPPASTSYPPPAAATAGAGGIGSSSSGRMTYKTQKGETLNSVAWKFGYTTPYFRHINKNVIPANVSDDAVIPEGITFVVSDGKGNREDFASFQPPGQAATSSNQQSIASATAETFLQAPKQNAPNFEYAGEYIVKTGDTLQSVAKLYNISPEKLAAANGLKPDQALTPRSILKIPK